MNILITGATGFIGQALTHNLFKNSDHQLILSSRENFDSDIRGVRKIITGSINANTDWSKATTNTDIVIHSAGIAHRKNITAEQYDLTHVIATKNLAQQSIRAGVKQFIYLSSIGVHGRSSNASFFSESSPFQPENDYTKSKHRTEQMLKALCDSSPMRLTIIRPPLVYAAHAPGNFQRLLYATHRGIPMPVGNIENRRSIIALENLAGFIAHCTDNPGAMNQDFLIADSNPPLSTKNIIQYIAEGMGKPARTLNVPQKILQRVAQFAGQTDKYLQLCGDLMIDTNKASQLLGWHAPFSTMHMLVKAGEDYLRILKR